VGTNEAPALVAAREVIELALAQVLLAAQQWALWQTLAVALEAAVEER